MASVGRLKAGPERELFERFSGRARAMARSAGLTGIDVIEVDEGRSRTVDERRREEASALAARIPAGAHLMILDEGGAALTSAAFATALGKMRDAGLPCFALAIGGPDGFDAGFRQKAQATMAFGAATLPHQLVRVLAAEQVYRALTILTGHPYHRA